MELLPSLKTGKLIIVLVSPMDSMSNLIAELALRGPVTVLDGGNCFPAYRIAQLIRRKSIQVESISKRIFLRRAFTCYQMLNLLENAPNLPQPHIVLNLLSTFQDAQVKPAEADRLLHLCLDQIGRLSLTSPTAVSISSAPMDERSFLLEGICKCADEVFILEENIKSSPQQTSMF
jgi:hypothetical protein